jgi:hypothetical protein
MAESAAAAAGDAAHPLLLLSSLAKKVEANVTTAKVAADASPGQNKRKREGGSAAFSAEGGGDSGSGSKKPREATVPMSPQAMLAAVSAMLPGATSLMQTQAALHPQLALREAAAALNVVVHSPAAALPAPALAKGGPGKKSDEEKQKIKQKKATHNATEKRRQARISMQFVELKNLIESASGQTIRRGRGQILAATLLFMGAILQENLTLRNSMNQLLAHQQLGQNSHVNRRQGGPPAQVPPPIASQHMLQYRHAQQPQRWPQNHMQPQQQPPQQQQQPQPQQLHLQQMSAQRMAAYGQSTSTQGTKRF